MSLVSEIWTVENEGRLYSFLTTNAGTDRFAELAAKVFELSQPLRQQWLTADYSAKRRILEIVCLNCRLVDVTLVPTIRKPFDVLVEGLSFPSRGGSRTAIELFVKAIVSWPEEEKRLIP